MPPFLPDPARASTSSLLPLELRSLLAAAARLAPHSSPSDNTSPTRTTQPRKTFSRTLSSIFRRQVTVTATPQPIIPATYSGLNPNLSAGLVVAIVFGSVAAFLLILWLIYTCMNMTRIFGATSSVVEEETVVRRRSRSPRRPPSNRTRSEVIEVSRTRERERTVTRSPSRSRSRTPPQRTPPRMAETIVIEETRRTVPPPVEREDEYVEVIEHHSPPPRRESRRTSERQSGFRIVDPEAFGGGNRPPRRVSRR